MIANNLEEDRMKQVAVQRNKDIVFLLPHSLQDKCQHAGLPRFFRPTCVVLFVPVGFRGKEAASKQKADVPAMP